MSQSVFRSAIADTDGAVDAGYLALFWTMAATVSAIPVVLIVCAIAAWKSPEKAGEILQATGIAIGAICTGAGVVIGAVGGFRLGDKPRAGTPATTTTTKSETVVETAPTATNANPMPVVVKNPDPVPVIETKRKGKR